MNIPLRSLGLAGLACFALVPRQAAQDVTVGGLRWFQPFGVPDTPPKTQQPLRPDFPRDLRKTGEIGYVIVTRCLDAQGQSLMLEPRSSNSWYSQAVTQASSDWKMTPAMLAGKPVNSWFWVPVIFNPASAAADLADATPRLLEVTPVVVSPAIVKKLRENTTAWGTVSLDSSGVPLRVKLEAPASDELRPFVDAALEQWRFAPARKDGRPIAAELRLAFLFYPPIAPVPGNQKPPKATRQSPPVYPYEMLQSGLVGEVTLSFVVDTKGNVVNPVVIRSNNPAFDQPAIAALLKWKFEAGTVDDRPVDTTMRVPIIFLLGDGGGREAVSVTQPSRRQQAKMPEEIRYDVAPKPRGFAKPVFPYPLLLEGKTGNAVVLFQISAEGKVTSLKVAEASQPEFGLALVAAAETYEFDPALKGGHPVATVARTEQAFTTNQSDHLVVSEDLALLRREKKKPETIMGADRLDAPLKPLSRKAPQFPVTLARNVDHGEAVIEWLVDETGHARLPRIISASEPAFGYAAVQAVAQWLFETPKSGGKPAVARARVPFEFRIAPPVLGTAVGTPPQTDQRDPASSPEKETSHDSN
jgi:TonB family protein